MQVKEIKLKILLGMMLSKNRTQLLNIINRTPKKFGNVSFKTKHTEKVGDLKLKDEKGDTVICSSAKAKADSLCKFFSRLLYFVMKEMNVLMHLMIESFLKNLHQYE